MKRKASMARATALAVSIFMLLSSLSGCGGSNTSSGDTSEKSATKTADTKSTDLYKVQILTDPLKVIKTSSDTDIGKIIKEKFNIEFEFIPITGDQKEKQNLMLASGDYPEIVRLEGNDMVNKYIAADALVCLDDYVASSKNFSERFKEQIPYWRVASPDGKLYKWEMKVPQDFEASPQVNDIGVRTDALEKQGWPNLVSEDDWFNFLKKSMEQMPQSNGQKTIGMVIPFAESWGPALTAFIEKGGKYVDEGTNDAVIWNQIDQKWEEVFKTKEVIDNYRWFNKLYRAGILDPDCFTDTLDQVRDKLTSGRALSMWYVTWEIGGANGELATAGHQNMQYIHMPVRSNAQVASGEKRLIRVETTRPFDSIAITKNAKDPERLFKLVDWCLSDEGQVLLQSGVEGKQYKIVDGKRVPTDEYIKKLNTDTSYVETTGLGQNGNIFGFLGLLNLKGKDGISYNLSTEPAYADSLALTERQKNAYQKLGWKTSMDYWLKVGQSAPSGLTGTCSLDPSSQEGKLNEKFNTFRIQAGAKLITAKTEADFEKTLKDVMDQYDKLGLKKVVDKYNQLLAENKAKIDKFK
jgi:ABC-type glycerol-3-phosphate transport system substrate-binding protein